MDLRQLRYFVGVAEHLSFRKAARHLNITEPPLSRQIRLLEDEFGVRLFVRDKKRIYLTDAGAQLLPEARKLLTHAENIISTIGLKNRIASYSIRIGVGLALSNKIRKVAVEYIENFPDADVQYIDIYSVDQTKALLNKEIDIGFLRPSDNLPELCSVPVFKEGFQVILPNSHRMSGRKSLRLEEISDETLLVSRTQSRASRNCLMGMYERLGVKPKMVTVEAVPTEAGGISVAAGRGIYIVPGAWIKPSDTGDNLVAIPLVDEDAVIDVHVVWRRDDVSPAVKTYLKTVWQVFGVDPNAA